MIASKDKWFLTAMQPGLRVGSGVALAIDQACAANDRACRKLFEENAAAVTGPAMRKRIRRVAGGSA